MAQEIERYLMEKFSRGLEMSSSSLRWYKQFQDIKTLLEEKVGSSLSETEKISLREKLYLLNNILTECQTLARKRTWYSPQELLTLYHIERNLSKIKGELRVIRDIDIQLGPNGHISPSPNGEASSPTGQEISQWTSESVDESKVHGFEDEVMSLEKLLLHKTGENQFNVIGIVGVSGIGKTTLCQVIFNRKEFKNHFVPRIWVSISERLNEEENPKMAIVKRMLTDLGVEEEIIDSISNSHGLSGLVYALHLELVGKRYLIVIDDVGEKDPWYGQLSSCLTRDKKWHERLAYGLPKGYGGTVIVTSRYDEIAEMMVGEKSLHHLLTLSDSESCWKIFKDAVEEDNTPFNLSEVGDLKREIKQKCAGLPLAAKVMGKIMRGQIRENQQRATPSDITQGVYSIRKNEIV